MNDNFIDEIRPCCDVPGYSVGTVPPRLIRDKTGRARKAFVNPNSGYYSYQLPTNDGLKNRELHKLIARAFLGPTPPGLEIVHHDENKLNCHPSNLRFETHVDNMKRAGIAGAWAKPRLTQTERAEVLHMRANGVTNSVIANKFGMSTRNVRHICNVKRAANDNTPSSKGVAA